MTSHAYEKVFTRYAEEDPYYTIELISDNGLGVLDEHDWDNAKKKARFLGHFADITKQVSASLSVIAHTMFHEIGEIIVLMNDWLNNNDVVQVAMGKRMKEKFDKYWGQLHDIVENENENDKGKEKGKEKENMNLLIFVVVVLDPRYKLLEYTELVIQEIYGDDPRQKLWAALNKCLHGMFEEYRAFYSSDPTPQKSESHNLHKGEGALE
jgi:hypothetical protein